MNFPGSTRTGTLAQYPGEADAITQGNNAFMASFVSAGFELGSLVGTAHATQMQAAARGTYPFYSGAAWVSTTKGLVFYIGGSCLPVFPISQSCTSAQQNARMFGVEPVRALASAYLASPDNTKHTFLTQYYGAEWGNPMYGSSPYSDGGFISDCADNFDATKFWKYAYQCFALGSSASMPAALAGGVAPADNKTAQIGFVLPTGAATASFDVIQPNGVTTTTSCSTSPCAVTIDYRQGSHLSQATYKTGGGATVAQSSQSQIIVDESACN